LLKTAELMTNKMPEIQFVIAFAGSRSEKTIENDLKAVGSGSEGHKANILVTRGETYEALLASDAAAVTSGTATLETGIIGTPLVIVYKSSLFNYAVLRPLINVPHFGLINLIAGKRLANELIQYDLTPEKLSAELFRLLDPDTNAEVRGKLRDAVAPLGAGGAAARAAEAIITNLGLKHYSD
jgi:lipid-A-disaccharide synthase